MFDYNLLTCCSLFKLPRATSWSLVKYPFLHTEGLKVAVWLLPTAPLTLRKKKTSLLRFGFWSATTLTFPLPGMRVEGTCGCLQQANGIGATRKDYGLLMGDRFLTFMGEMFC